MDAGQQLTLPALRRVLLVPGLILSLSSCDEVFPELRMHMQTHRPIDTSALQLVFAEQSRVRIAGAEPGEEVSALQALTSDRADLGLVENSAAFTPGVRAVLPVFQSVLHVLVREDFKPASGEQPMRGASFYIMNQSSAGHDFVDLVTRRQGLEPGEYEKTTRLEPGETDVIIYFGAIDPNNTNWYQPGYELVSLAHEFNPQRQFYQEGIGYSAPNMQPASIPALTYFLPGNAEEVQTVAVDTLLVARKDVPVPLVYELTRTFLEQKPRFVAIAPALFSGINESFDPLDLSFPLHAGARRYLYRDEPGLLERYAESINLLVYLTFLVLTGFLGFARWRAQRKKDRIDRFYAHVLQVRDRASDEDPTALLRELEELEREAFDSLIREKLAANESFRIFTDLLADTRQRLRDAGDRART